MSLDTPVHLIGRFDDPFTGAERALLDLADALVGRRKVQLWSDSPMHPLHHARGVRPIRAFAGEFPKGGMMVFGGVHVQPGVWLQHANPERLALGYNLPNHGALFRRLEQLAALCPLEPEILFVSQALQDSVSLPGVIEPPMIDLAPFLAVPLQRPATRPFTVGRISRDVPEKHHDVDPALYRLLAAQGMQVRVMGGTCLHAALQGVPGVELLRAGAEPVPEFLASLDAFIYRTGSSYESYGRVIFEALASGLPVVASRHGGYAATLRGCGAAALVETQEQALLALSALARDAPARMAMAPLARAFAMDAHGAAARENVLAKYL